MVAGTFDLKYLIYALSLSSYLSFSLSISISLSPSDQGAGKGFVEVVVSVIIILKWELTFDIELTLGTIMQPYLCPNYKY